MAELKELQPSFSTGYMMMLKSPIKHQAEIHCNLIESSSTHISFLALSSDGPYTPPNTPIQNRLPPPSTKQKQKIYQ